MGLILKHARTSDSPVDLDNYWKNGGDNISGDTEVVN
jgi:hypothetical protein